MNFDGLNLTKNNNTIKDTFRLEIEGDENDGDYKTQVTTFSTFEELKLYLSLISKLGKEITSTGVQDRDDYTPTEEESDLIYDICPHNEYGMHDLNVQEFVYFDENGDKFDVGFEPEFYL